MSKYVAIKTELGELNGRDCIYLDHFKVTDGTCKITLTGEINGDLCEKRRSDKFIPYKLIFLRVMAHKVIELDSWDGRSESSFDEVRESDWISSLGGKVTNKHRHFLVQTYDDVIEVVCEDFKFKTKANA
jgi:hypothetical protein